MPTTPPPPQAETPCAASRSRVLVGVVLLLLLVLGGVLRMQGLGELGLIGDEGYQYQAVEGVMQRGVPRLDSGYVYSRAPHFVYVQAGVASVLGLDAFALRLPAVVFGLVCIPLAYLLGRDLADARAGLLLAALMALSVWEVEISRYARFYTLLQACYLGGLLCFFRGYIGGSTAYKLGFWGVTLLAIATHQLGVMLGLCFLTLLPLPGYSRCARVGFAVQSGAAAALYVGWRVLEKSTAKALYGADYRPLSGGEMAELKQAVSGEVAFQSGLLPELALPRFELIEPLWRDYRLALVALLALACVALGAVVLAAVRSGRGWVGALAALAIVAAGAQLGALAFALVLLLFAVAVRERGDALRPVVLLGWLGPLVLIGGYVATALLRSDMGVLSTFIRTISFPDVERFIVAWMRGGWPVVGLLALAGSGVVAWRARNAEGTATGRWLLLGMLALPVLAASVVGGKHNEARYFFMLYPLILLLVSCLLLAGGDAAARLLGRRSASTAVLVVGLVSLMFLSADFRPADAWAVGQRAYGQPRDRYRSVMNTPLYGEMHQDQAGVGRYVAEVAAAGERVLLVGPPHRTVNFSIYTGRADYMLGNLEYHTRLARDAEGTLIDPDTGAEIIYTPERLREVLASAGGGRGLWVLADHGLARDRPIQLPDALRLELFRQIDVDHAWVGADGVTFAVHLVPAAADAAPAGSDPPDFQQPLTDLTP